MSAAASARAWLAEVEEDKGGTLAMNEPPDYRFRPRAAAAWRGAVCRGAGRLLEYAVPWKSVQGIFI
jgi:hypothetical protein